MKLGIKIKKTFSIISILSILATFSLPFSYTYAQTQAGSYSSVITAVMGCSGAGEKISSLLSSIFEGESSDQISGGVKTTDEKTKEQSKKEKCWDAIGYAAAKTALAALTQTTINYINSGFEGNPYFALHENSLLASIGNQEVYSFVSELNNPEKYPFGPEIAQSIATTYDCKDPLDNGACFRDTAVFTLAEDIGENWKDFGDDFSVGGWEGWLSTTQNPYNNPIGFNFEASKEINRRVDKEQSTIKEEISTNGGFLSVKKCVAYYQVEEVTTTTKDGTFTSYEKVLDDNGNPIISAVETGDTSNNREILYYNNEGNPVYDTGDISSSYNYEYSYLGEVDHCARYETTTPGSVISDQLNIHLGSSVRQLELADEMNESLAAVFDALINKLVYDGLDSLQTASLETTQSGGYGSNSGYFESNNDGSWYTDPLAPVDLYLALRCVKAGSIIPGSDTGAHAGFWGGLYGGPAPEPGIDGGTEGIGYEDIAGGIDGEIAELEDGDEATGYADPGVDDADYGGPATVFGVTGGTKGAYGDLITSEPPCKTDIARTEEYIEVLKQARGLVSRELLPLLRKLDKTLPEPDVGWETRVYTEYLSQRDTISQTLDADLTKLNYLSMIPLAGIVTGLIAPKKIESANQAIESLDTQYIRELDKIKYDINHHNIPSAPVARVETQKIPTYEEVSDAYNQVIAAQQANLARLNYINSELPSYIESKNPENAILMDRLQSTYSYASPNLATESTIETTITEIDNIDIDIQTAKNILPVIEEEALLCNGWNSKFACHDPINTNELSKIASKRFVLTNPLLGADVVVTANMEENTLLGLIRFCWPDGVNLSTTAYSSYASDFWTGGAYTSLCTTDYLIAKGLGATDQEAKDYIYLVYQYKNKLLIPIDETANPYSIYYPFPNPPYNPWTMNQLVDPIPGEVPISVDGYLPTHGQNIYSNYLSLEARIFFHWVGEVSDDSTRRLQINPFIKAYDNSKEYGY